MLAIQSGRIALGKRVFIYKPPDVKISLTAAAEAIAPQASKPVHKMASRNGTMGKPMLYLLSALLVCIVLFAIAEPYRFMPERKKKKKLVGSTYWGVYPGAPTDEDESQRTVELKPASRKIHYAAGSITYSQGRGVSMNGRK